MVESRTPIMEQNQELYWWGRVKDPNYSVELRTLINLVVKEYLYDNIQIRFKSEEILYKASCIELETPN